jgi:acetyl esterase/lipase
MRSPGPLLFLVFVLVLTACGQTAVPNAEVGSSGTLPTSTTMAPTTTQATTTTAATTTSTSLATTTTSTLVTGSTTLSADGELLTTADVPFTASLLLDVVAPATPGSYPTVVLFHGGGWVGGSPAEITPLANAMAAAGTVVFNAPYRLALQGGGYPMTFEDASCAVRFAREYAPQFGGDAESVIVVGYSAGAHIGAVTALAGDSFEGDCIAGSAGGLPDAFVGVAGPYDTDLLDPLMGFFFGTDRAEDPAPWEDGNPFTHIGENPDLVVRLVHGELDLLAPAGFSISLSEALEEAGYDVALTVVEDGTHSSVVDPLADGTVVVEIVQTISG